MKKQSIKPLTLFISLVSLIFIPSCAATLVDSNYCAQKLKNGIDAIQSYEVNLKTKLFYPIESDLDQKDHDQLDPNNFMEFRTIVYGEAGKKMKIKMITNSPEVGVEMEHTLIFDGMWLWVQEKANKHPKINNRQPFISAFKIHIPSVSPDPVKEPFNTVFGVTGTGLFRYRDLPGTFMDLIEEYTFICGTKPDSSKEIIFLGKKKANKKRPKNEMADKEFAKFVEESDNFCKLWVSEKNNRIMAYLIGKSEKRPTMKTKIEYITVNKKLPNNIFSYIPPRGVVIRDITTKVLEHKAKHK